MLAFTAITAIVTCCLLSIVDGSPAAPPVSDMKKTFCGAANKYGIQSPTQNQTLLVTLKDQDNWFAALPVIYCSDAYFKTASLNVTATLSGNGSPLGQILETVQLEQATGLQPDNSMADGGYYGYNFTVRLIPELGIGDWEPNLVRTLHIMEWQTGYGFEYGIVIDSVDFFIKLEADPTEPTSSVLTPSLGTTGPPWTITKPSITSWWHLPTSSSSTRHKTTSAVTTTTPMYTYSLPSQYPGYTGGLLTEPLD